MTAEFSPEVAKQIEEAWNRYVTSPNPENELTLEDKFHILIHFGAALAVIQENKISDEMVGATGTMGFNENGVVISSEPVDLDR